jgi:hypothetical protein
MSIKDPPFSYFLVNFAIVISFHGKYLALLDPFSTTERPMFRKHYWRWQNWRCGGRSFVKTTRMWCNVLSHTPSSSSPCRKMNWLNGKEMLNAKRWLSKMLVLTQDEMEPLYLTSMTLSERLENTRKEFLDTESK